MEPLRLQSLPWPPGRARSRLTGGQSCCSQIGGQKKKSRGEGHHGRDPERALWGGDGRDVTWSLRRTHPGEEGPRQWRSMCKGPAAGWAAQEQQAAGARWRLGDLGAEGKARPCWCLKSANLLQALGVQIGKGRATLLAWGGL